MDVISTKCQKALETLTLPSELGRKLEDEYDDDFDENVAEPVKEHFDWNTINVQVKYGVSKMAIIPEGENYVIKIPFNGEYYYEDGDYQFINFNGCDTDNYCEDEYQVYRAAKLAGVDCFFAEVAKPWISTYGWEHPVYLQEYVKTFGDERFNNSSKHSCSNDSKAMASNIRKKAGCLGFDELWLGEALEWYGEEIFRKFIDFVVMNNIDDDMHSGNYGYRLDGSPCLLDTSGWHH